MSEIEMREHVKKRIKDSVEKRKKHMDQMFSQLKRVQTPGFVLDDKFMNYTIQAKKTIMAAQQKDELQAPADNLDGDLALNNPDILRQYKLIEESKRPTFIDQLNELIHLEGSDDEIDVGNKQASDDRVYEAHNSNNVLHKNEDFRDYLLGSEEPQYK